MRRACAALLTALAIAACASVPVPAPTAAPTPPPTEAATATIPSPSVSRTPTPSPARTPDPTSPVSAHADLERLITAREQYHPDPWHGISRDDYVAQVSDVIARADGLNDDQLLVELTRLAAVPSYAGRDGHGGILPWTEGSRGGHALPLRLYWFDDGIFVTAAMPDYNDVVGHRVAAIAGHPIDDVLGAVEPLVPRDNGQQVLSHSPYLIVLGEVLHGLDLIDAADATVDVTFADDDETTTRAIEPIALSTYSILMGGFHSLSPPTRPGARWLRNLSQPAWLEIEAETRTAYLGYNLTNSDVNQVANQLAAALDDGLIYRLVIDVRHNPGGDNTTYGLLLSTVRRAAEELPSPVYLIIGRATFSAAGNFAAEVEQIDNVVLVGEDSGGSPNQFGDAVLERLGYSGLSLHVATSFQLKTEPTDTRITIEPDIAAPLTSTDYFSDVDPAWEAIQADSK